MKQTFESVDISRQLKDDYLSYAMQTLNRSLPSVVDGLKVSQRRIIQIMKNGYSSTDKLAKVMKVSGLVTGLLHPHAGAEGTIITMGDRSVTPYALTHIHGNVGGWNVVTGKRISSDNPAAARYLECKLSEFGDRVFDNDIRHLTTRASYDEQTREVVEFVPAVPVALFMGNVGISVGYATKMAPYKFEDVINTAIAIAENADSVDIPKIFFPSGSRILKDEGYRDYLTTGKGTIKVQGKWTLKRDGTIIVTELPFVDAEEFCEKIRAAVSSGKLIIKDVKDYSKDHVDVHITPQKGYTQKQTLANLLATTPLEDTFGGNNTVLVNGLPVVLNSVEIISHWFNARKEYIVSEFSYKQEQLQKRLHLINGFLVAIEKLDETIKQIRLSSGRDNSIERLVKILDIDKDQASYIVDLKLHRISNTSKKELLEERKNLRAQLKGVALTVKKPEVQIVSQLKNLLPFVAEETTVVVKSDKWTQKAETTKKSRPKSLKARIREHAQEIGIPDSTRNRFLKQDHKGIPLTTAWPKFAKEYSKKKKLKFIKFEAVSMPEPAEAAAMIKRINTWCKRQHYKGIRKATFAALWKENGSEAGIRRAIAKENK